MKLTALPALLAVPLLLSACPGKPSPSVQVSTPVRTGSASSPGTPATGSAATPPSPGTGSIADPLATPPAGLPREVSEAQSPAGAAQYKPLPEGLDVRSYRGEGLLLDIIVTDIKPGPSRGDPARLSYALVEQQSEHDHQLARASAPLVKPPTLKLRGDLVQVEATARFKAKKLGRPDPSGQAPARHAGWYDIQLRDSTGRALGRFGVTGMGWVSMAPPAQQPTGIEAQATGEGSSMGQLFDFFPLDGGPALLRMEAVEYGQQEFTVTAGDGSLHDITMPHVALRFLPAGTFETSAEKRREDFHPRDPEADHQPPK